MDLCRTIHSVSASLGVLACLTVRSVAGADATVTMRVAALLSYDWEGKAPTEAARALGPEAIPILKRYAADAAQCTADREQGRRVRSVELLGALREASAVPEITKLLGAACPEVIIAASNALGDIQDRAAVHALVELVAKRPLLPASGFAIRALGKIGEDSALPALEGVTGGDVPPDLKREATKAIAAIRAGKRSPKRLQQ